MFKYLFSLLIVLSVSGCYFTFNGSMCDQIASDPHGANIPKECQNYNEDKAEKAYFNHKKPEDINRSTTKDELELEKEKN